jgi:hypothetical protein
MSGEQGHQQGVTVEMDSCTCNVTAVGRMDVLLSSSIIISHAVMLTTA